MPLYPHPNIRRVETRQEVTTYQGPDLARLEPGESVELTSVPKPRVEWTHDQRVHFENGGILEDLPGEDGLKLTRPDGTTATSPGWMDIEQDGIKVFVRASNDDGTWTQSMTRYGTIVDLEGFDGPLKAELGLDGTLSAGARREGEVLVLDEAQAWRPVVPLEWLTVG